MPGRNLSTQLPVVLSTIVWLPTNRTNRGIVNSPSRLDPKNHRLQARFSIPILSAAPIEFDECIGLLSRVTEHSAGIVAEENGLHGK